MSRGSGGSPLRGVVRALLEAAGRRFTVWVAAVLVAAAAQAAVYCTDWAELKGSLEAGGTATLKANLTAGEPIAVSGTAALNLNGKTITCPDERISNTLFVVGKNVSLTVSDSSAGQTGTVRGPSGTNVVDGGVFAVTNGTLVISGGTFTNFTAAANGGVISAEKATLKITGGSFLGCRAGAAGGAVFARLGGLTVVRGLFAGNAAGTAGTADFGLEDMDPGDDGGVSGGLFGTWPATFDALLDTGFAKATVGAMTIVGKEIAVQSGKIQLGTFTFNPSASPYSAYVSLASGSTAIQSGEFWIVSDGSVPCATWDALKETLEAGVSASLSADISMTTSGTIEPPSGDFSLDLNGRRIMRGAGVCNTASMFSIANGAKLAILDSAGTGEILGPSSDVNAAGGVFTVGASGTLVIGGGTFSGFSTTLSGGVINITDGGTVTIADGTFVSCAADEYGGVAFATGDGSVLQIAGGTFRQNRSDGTAGATSGGVGGVACVEDGAALSVSAGLFTGNAAVDAESADFGCLDGGSVTLSGGVFDRDSGLTKFTFASDCRRGLAGTSCVVGKDVLSSGAYVRSGTFDFDPSAAPYASRNLIDKTVSTVTKAGATWRVTSTVDDGLATCWSWGEITNALLSAEDVSLVTNVTADGGVTLDAAQKVKLRLNGYTLVRSSVDAGAAPFTVGASASLAVLETNGTGRIEGPESMGILTSPMFLVQTGGALEIAGCTLSGHRANVAGALVSAAGGSVTISNAVVSGCSVYGANGGAVCVQDGQLSMTSNAFSNCSAENGGAFAAANSAVSIEAVSFEDCQASSCGGAAYAKDCSSFAFAPATCCGNACVSGSGDVLYVAAGSATVTAGLFITDTEKMALACGKGATVSVRGGVFDYWATAEGVAAETGYEQQEVGDWIVFGKTLAVSGDHIRCGFFTFNPRDPIYASCEILDSDATVEKDDSFWHVVDSFTPCSTWAEVGTVLVRDRGAVLSAGMTADSKITIDGIEVILDLAGYKVTVDGSCAENNLFEIINGGSLTIVNSIGSGVIQGWGKDKSNWAESAIVVRGGSFTLNGGTICDFHRKENRYDACGAAIRGEDATITINGGSITNCSVSQGGYGIDETFCGGAIYLDGGTFIQQGGTILACSAEANGSGFGSDSPSFGGAVYAKNAAVSLLGGTIRKCSAYRGGAVCLDSCTSAQVENFVFSENDTGKNSYKGGRSIYATGTEVTIESCFCDNTYSTSSSDDRNFSESDSYSSHHPYTFHGGVYKGDESEYNFGYVEGFSRTVIDRGNGLKYSVVGKGVEITNGKITKGTFTFSPMMSPYSDFELCDPAVVSCEQDAETGLWTVSTHELKPAQQITQAGTAPGTVLTEGVYEVNENVTLTGAATQSALEVNSGATVAIYIKKGCTLTLKGGDASGRTAAGAGFRVRSGSELIVLGDGTLNATGGNNGKAGNGAAGGNASMPETSGYDRIYGGAGGNGGDGAAGAAAGIGGIGGAGGVGGSGSHVSSTDRYCRQHGPNGCDGGSGSTGESAGTVNFLGCVSVYASGGVCQNPAGGSGGSSGGNFNQYRDYERALDVAAGGGGGGGGGGVYEVDAPAIGGGCGGGGGGGAGGGGGMDAIEYGQSRSPAHGGYGNGGNNEGSPGQGDVSWSKDGKYRGGYGGNGGSPAGNGSDGAIYLSQTATLDGASQTAFRETHDFLKRTIIFDYDGGVCRGATTSSRTVYLYMDLPDAPLPDKTVGNDAYLFMGYYTQKNGQGTMVYDGTGEACLERWTIDNMTTYLYAYWRCATPPPDPLHVTRLDDEAFNPDESNITFRAAVTWAMLVPTLTGKDGTLSKVTFAPELFTNANDVTVVLTNGQIRISEFRFKDHPLLIQGPTDGLRNVTVDATKSKSRILDIGIDNRVRVAHLTFTGGAGDSSGGAINMKGGVLALFDCTFSGNAAATEGGAVHLGADGTYISAGAMTNVIFTSNAATHNGGAVMCYGTLALSCCRFESNKAGGDGGALCGQTNSQIYADHSTFWQNSAQSDGGAWASGGGLFALDCTIIGNSATARGGGYALLKGAGTGSLRNQFVNCTFRKNSAKDGGGICATEEGALSLLNTLVADNSRSSGSNTSVDLYVNTAKASVTAVGVVAPKTNLTGGESCNFSSSLKWSNIFSNVNSGQYRLTVGESEQNVEILSERADNPAFSGYDGSPYRTDITGRSFESCQIGSWWRQAEKPSLVVTTLADGEDAQDGQTSLREVLAGIKGGEDKWRALLQDGVYRVTFKAGIAGTYDLALPHMEVSEPSGAPIEIDGGAAAGGVVAFVGDATSGNEFRAFFVPAGTTLRLRNLAFTNCLGRSTVGSAATQTHDGGAIVNCGSLAVERCAFAGCSAGNSFANPVGYGGGIANGRSGVSGAKLAVTNCTFAFCRAAKGGGIYNWSGCTADIFGSGFVSNCVGATSAVMTAAGGAIFNESGATLSYAGSVFEGNTAIIDGKTETSDVEGRDLGSVRYAVTVKDGVTTVGQTTLAEPSIASEGDDAGLKVEETTVSLMPSNVQAFLYYGLGRSDTPDGEYTVSTWVRADYNGRLPAALTAPKSGDSGYYRIFVSVDGK